MSAPQEPCPTPRRTLLRAGAAHAGILHRRAHGLCANQPKTRVSPTSTLVSRFFVPLCFWVLVVFVFFFFLGGGVVVFWGGGPPRSSGEIGRPIASD